MRHGLALLAGLVLGPMVASDLQATVITVDNTADEIPAMNNGRCSLREAIENADDDAATNPDCAAGTSGEDVIRLPASSMITLDSSLAVRSEYVISGNGATIVGSGGLVFSTAGQTGSLTLRALTLDGGGGLCISNAGGDITYVLDRVTLVRCSLAVSIAASSPSSSVRLRVINSTIQPGAGGLAISLAGDGIEADIINSTITQSGIGVSFSSSTVRMANTLLADNATNCTPSPVMTGVNLSDDATCGPASANLKVVADAMLGPLADNGGPTMTRALLPGSPAIDMAEDAICASEANGIDQRGAGRPADGDGDGVAICDIGAFEVRFVRSVPAVSRTGFAVVLMLLLGIGIVSVRRRGIRAIDPSRG